MTKSPTRAALALGSLLLMFGLVLPGPGLVSSAHAATTVASPPLAGRYGLPDFADLVAEVGPAVVNISVTQQLASGGISPDDPFYDFLRRFGVPLPQLPPGSDPRGQRRGDGPLQRGVGSGFIVSSDGYVLTNAHVVDDANEVTVKLTDKREFKAKVVGVDKRTDVALLKVEAKGLPTVRIGDAEQSRVGEWVVAVGSPFGFESTVTAGIISAKARRLPDENYVPFIQTDVAINPGNSGGPLFNLAGEVVGINSQIYSRSGGFMGISFAIPIDVAMKVKEQLQQFGKVQRGRLGVAIQSVDKDLAQSFGLPDATGALIASVEPDSPADKAGLLAGDVVLSVNGDKVRDSSDLPRMIGELRPGTRTRLGIWRDSKAREVTVTLGSMGGEEVATAGSKGEDAGGALGLSARALTAQEAAQLDIDGGGLVVETVEGAAARAGLRQGDVLLALNNQRITGVAQFRKLLSQAGKRFALLVQRGPSRIFVPITLE